VTEARTLLAALALCCLALLGLPLQAQGTGEPDIAVELVADGTPRPGEDWLLALHFTPKSPEWHGYWSNPGDAGLGMTLGWQLPHGWQAKDPLYPVPQTLIIGGLMNHVYEGDYSVLVPVSVPPGAAVTNIAPITVEVDYLACTDRICVPQHARLALDPSRAPVNPHIGVWRAAIAPLLDSKARFEVSGNRLRIGIPLPAEVRLGDPHLFVDEPGLSGGFQPEYTGRQSFTRDGDLLVAEVPLEAVPTTSAVPAQLAGILSFGKGEGVRFKAEPGEVPLEGMKPVSVSPDTPPLALLLLAALVGGLLLNIMPCVFPILSLKALALAKAGGDEHAAHRDALSYTAGVVVACAALGATLLLLRSAGEEVGWAFQLQEPGVVVALLLLAIALTANFLGLFEVPGMALSGGAPNNRGSFATGLLAAFVATPCTGPFMAAALGAALLLPPLEAMLLFVALGLGVALPFLAVGYIPALRRRLPKPGRWMVTFRRWMALPMGMTALALVWLLTRLGDATWLAMVGAVAVLLLALIASLGQRQRAGKHGEGVFAAAIVGLAILAATALPAPVPDQSNDAAKSLLDPQPFSEARLAQARASGKPVFVWFTADWCVTCKVNESVAIEREATRDAFRSAGVIALRGDFTRRDPEIASFLAHHGAAGVPLYLWYAPGSEAEQLPQVLTPDRLVELASR